MWHIWLIAALIVGLLVAILSIWLFARMDCDFTLLFMEKLGKPISQLKGKTVWITGASSGIGEYLAYELAKVNAKLILSGTNEARLEEVKRQCIDLGHLNDEDVLIARFDISNYEEQQKQFNKVIAHFSKLDILVNNAGRSQRALFHEIDIAVDKEMFDINVFGMINLTRIVLRHWLENEQKGQFVVTSSTAGKIGIPNSATYTASKHALHGYFECLRTEVSMKGIKVTMVCPGPVFSKIVERAFTGESNKVFGGSHAETNKRMATSRCAQLMAVSIVNELSETWISIQPALTLYYFFQYMPAISRFIFPRLATPERMHKMREGN